MRWLCDRLGMGVLRVDCLHRLQTDEPLGVGGDERRDPNPVLYVITQVSCQFYSPTGCKLLTPFSFKLL
jgi:hypothetical protein